MEEVKQNPVQEAKPERKKIMLSGIQPTGTFTLGNYLGAVRNWRVIQDEYNCYYFIADLHSMTIHIDPQKRREQTRQAFALLLACGIDTEKSLVFVQSHNKCHAEMGWIKDCCSQFGELSRMTQFKDKSQKHPDNINAGLFTYPALMAGDILLYQANLVPVGKDQTQHLEICRDIATRFNGIYGNVFTVPEGYYPKLGANIMSLQDPLHKMSKSDADDCFISMLDEPDAVRRKIRRAVTDSDGEIRYNPETKPGVSNLLTILCALTGEAMEDAVARLSGKGYGELKAEVTEAAVSTLAPIQQDFKRYLADKAFLEETWRQGAERASRIAERTLSKAMKKIGFIPR